MASHSSPSIGRSAANRSCRRHSGGTKVTRGFSSTDWAMSRITVSTGRSVVMTVGFVGVIDTAEVAHHVGAKAEPIKDLAVVGDS